MQHNRASTRGPSWVHESPVIHMWDADDEKCGVKAKGVPGAPSLRNIAMRCALADQRNLSLESFQGLPWHFAKEMWECLGRYGKQTLYMWKLLAKVYPDQFRQVAPYKCMKVNCPRMPVRKYLGLTQGDASNWATVITLAAPFARVPELVDIPNVAKNLVALEISTMSEELRFMTDPDNVNGEETTMTLSDRIVRTWGELARSSGAFAHLRVLSLRDQDDLSRMALHYLTSFPALRVILIQNCPKITLSKGIEQNGWAAGSFSQLVRGTDDSWSYSLYELYKASLLAVDAEYTLSRDTPILDFQMGGSLGKSGLRSPPTVLFRREAMELEPREPELKRPRLGENTGRRKAVMKDRRGKDLTGVLEEFL